MKNYDIILASNSQRRKELLKYIFEDFKIIPSNIDERELEQKFLSKTLINQNLVNYVIYYPLKNVRT